MLGISLATLTGCAPATVHSELSPRDLPAREVVVSGVSVWVQQDQVESDAGFVGVVDYLDSEDCFVLRDLDDEGTYRLAVWPAGTQLVDADARVLGVPGVGSLKPGDVISGGGQGMPIPDNAPVQCSTGVNNGFAVFLDTVGSVRQP